MTNTMTTTSGVTYTARELWDKACEHDGIQPNSKFVVFSDANPWMKKYNTLMLLQQTSRMPKTTSESEWNGQD